MRKLLYVPVIHTEPDLGSVASSIDKEGAVLCGERRWARHKEVVAKFWQVVSDYFSSLDAAKLKIYQDGLPVDGEPGRRIIEEGAKRGSQNHQIILNLMKRGAEIRKTEDASLLRQEYKHITTLTGAKSVVGRATAFVKYRLHRDWLMKERDRFVAKIINETLKEGEIGVLFMGSHHHVIPLLSKDIMVEELKERERVKAYFKKLPFSGDAEYEQLADYLTSP